MGGVGGQGREVDLRVGKINGFKPSKRNIGREDQFISDFWF